jgi:hypothetical protein
MGAMPHAIIFWLEIAIAIGLVGMVVCLIVWRR